MKVAVNGIAFDDVSMDETVAWIVEMAQKRDRPRHVCTGNLDHLAVLQQDAEFRSTYESADLVLADGMPVVWLSRLGGGPRLRERVAGSDLFWELGKASASTGLRLFYLGGVPGAADAAADAVRRQCPGAVVCGTYCPSFEEFGTEAEQERIRMAIRETAPDILMVAFGAPKQEKWIVANKQELGVPVSIGVGGSFEMACGTVRRAPRWMQKVGLEWFYRLIQEPRRMGQRYLGRDLPFLAQLVFRTVTNRTAKTSP